MTTPNDPVLSRVTKRFGRKGAPVLDEVDLSLTPGSHSVVLGTNGSGKSTLLATVAGVLRQSSGTVSTPGPVGYLPERLPARLRFTAVEYLTHMGRIRGLGRDDARIKAKELLARFAVVPGPDTPFESLSKGNRQKVMIAQAFTGTVSTLVLDEPTSGLDQAAIQTLGQLVGESQQKGGRVLTSSQFSPTWAVVNDILRIAGGQLHREDPGAPVRQPEHGWTRVLAVSASPGEVPITGPMDGVVELRQMVASSTIELLVEPRVLDALLYDLIGRGWSIREVTPNYSGRPDAGS